MPKEYVYGATLKTVPELTGFHPTVAKVTWAREDAGGGVQMTVFRKDGTYESEHKLPMYMDLERGDINALIRVLRRARDQAYGSDE